MPTPSTNSARPTPRLAIVVADISPAGSIAKFRSEFPDRFVNTGVAEQIMIGMVAGMAQRGLRPFAYTIATFALYRPFEFVRDDLCYQNLPVTVVGIGGGVTYSTLGATHHAQEDVSIAARDPEHVGDRALRSVRGRGGDALVRGRRSKGPVYLRLGKAGEPVLTKGAVEPWRFGKIRYLRKGEDVCILTYGVIAKMAAEVADALAQSGQSVSLVSCHTMKPLDRSGIAEALLHHKRVVVIEEHAPQGGLAAQTKQIAWDTRAACRLDTFTLQDAFIHNYGSWEDLLDAHGLSTRRILEAIAR